MRTRKRKVPQIVDEMCTCGHLKSQHLPAFIMGVATLEMQKGNDQGRKAQPIAQGHGLCRVKDCDCGKFTFIRLVYKI